MGNRIIVIFIIILNSCSSSGQREIKSRYFTDVDIYSLQGINEINPTNYPNVEIADSGIYRVLKYHIDDNNFIQKNYTKIENTWVLNFFEKDDTANIYTTRIIYPGALIEFSYTDTIHYRLYDFGILRKDTMKYFTLNKPLDGKLTISDTSLLYQQAQEKVEFWYNPSNKHMKMVKKFNEKSDSIVTCYPALKRSFFWWFEIQDNLPSIPCE